MTFKMSGVRTACFLLWGISFLTLSPVRARSSHAFGLVAQAAACKERLSFTARQEIIITVHCPHKTVQSTRIVANVLQSGKDVRLTYSFPADAARRVVVDNGQILKQWQPQNHLILVEKTHEPSMADQNKMLRLLHQNYQCRWMRTEKENGLSCDLVRIEPRQGHAGPSRQIWIDRLHHAILRTEEFTRRGRCCYVSFYDRFHYISAPVPKKFALPSGIPLCHVWQNISDISKVQALSSTAGFAVRLPAWLPSGYTLIACSVLNPEKGKKIVLLRYSDGLKIISLSEQPESSGKATAAYKILTASGEPLWQFVIPPLQVAVTGDQSVPESVCEHLVEALQPKNAQKIRHRLAASFGAAVIPWSDHLRQRGWGYARIAAMGLALRAKHQGFHGARGQIASPSSHWELMGRAWLTGVLQRH